MEVSGQLEASATLPPGKEFQYSVNRNLVGSQSWFGCFREETNMLLLWGIKP
jgi:hypothetical protein